MYPETMALPDYTVTAGETKHISVPIYNREDRQIDAAGMIARFAISDYVNPDSEPFVIKPCVVKAGDDTVLAILFVELVPADTVNLAGRYICQITATDQDGAVGVLRGNLHIVPNNDKGAI